MSIKILSMKLGMSIADAPTFRGDEDPKVKVCPSCAHEDDLAPFQSYPNLWE
jgi:hypothetical protein